MSVLRGVRIGFVGAGTMGQALIKGLRADGVPARALSAADPDGAARRGAARRYGVWTTGDAAALARRSDVVILAVKPQQFPEVVAKIAPQLNRKQLVISIAAGITLRWLKARLPGVAVVRVMPNLPATVGCGFAGIAAGAGATRRHRAIALAIFRAVGDAAELPERHLDAVTAVSGSGPAYVFFLVDAWERAARRLGLPPAVATAAIQATLRGSACMLGCGAGPASELIRRVASKKGTTEAALTVFARRRVSGSIEEAIRAAARRAHELSWRG